MKLLEIFPKWHKLSRAPNIPWETTYNLEDDESFAKFLEYIIKEQSIYTDENYGYYLDVCEAMSRDVLHLQNSAPAGFDLNNLQYLQFEISLSPMRKTINHGDMDRAHDWILNGFSDNINENIEREFYSGRLEEFMKSNITWISESQTYDFIDWFWAFYYYCRRRAALCDVALLWLPLALKIIDRVPKSDERAIEALSMMQAWALDYDELTAYQISRTLEDIFEYSKLPLQSQLNIAMLFAVQLRKTTKREPRQWLAWIMENGAHLLRGHQPFQLLLKQVETQDDWFRLKSEIIIALDSYVEEIKSHFRKKTSFIAALDQRTELLNLVFSILSKLELGNEFLIIISRWYGVSEEMRIRDGVLFVCPNHSEGTMYLSKERKILRRNGPQQAETLTRITNRALGLTLTLQGDPTSPSLPERPGQPNYDEGVEFENTLKTAYNFDGLTAAMLAEARALVSYPALPHPIQALMSQARNGASLPLSSSLEEPRSDRAISKALLWSADNDLYSGFEIEAIDKIFSDSDISCDRMTGSGRSQKEFYEAYSDRIYDVVWIAGHGAYDHWKAGSAQLLAGDECSIGIDELDGRVPQLDARRLLVLNICDGGVWAVLGGMHKLGLAPILAGSRQATVSHLWPVDPLMAAAFGALFAGELCKCGNFFRAFERTLCLVRTPWHEITRMVRDLAPGCGIVSRLENNGRDSDNFFNWGSPCFFQ